MTKEEWNEMISDFDGFMKKQGYITVTELANKWYMTRGGIESLITNGRIQGIITIARKRYIPANTEMPERKRTYWDAFDEQMRKKGYTPLSLLLNANNASNTVRIRITRNKEIPGMVKEFGRWYVPVGSKLTPEMCAVRRSGRPSK